MINGTVLTLSQWQSQVSITQWYCNCELRHGKCSSLSCMRDSILKYRCFEWSLRPNYWPAKIYHWLRGWQEHIAGHHSQSSSSALLSLKISRPKLLSRRLLSIRLQLFSLNPTRTSGRCLSKNRLHTAATPTRPHGLFKCPGCHTHFHSFFTFAIYLDSGSCSNIAVQPRCLNKSVTK